MTDESTARPIDLHLPEGMNYSCIQCGRGCLDFDEIRVDPATVERLERLEVDHLIRTEQPGAPPVMENRFSPGEHVLNKTGPCGACVFLTEEKLCGLHSAYGIESKPNACRSFPFGFTETPGGVYACVSFACTAVLQNHGDPVREQEREIRETYEFSPAIRKAPDEILLTAHLPLTWEQYLLIEEDLRELLASTETDFPGGLIAQSSYLWLLKKFLMEARESSGIEPGGSAWANEEPLALFRKSMRGKDDGPKWARLFSIARKRKSSPVNRRIALGYILSFRKVLENRSGRLGAAAMVVTTYLRHVRGKGIIELPGQDKSVSYRDIQSVRFDPNQPEQRELLRRFHDHCLFRKDLLLLEEVTFAHNVMLMAYALIHWYSAALAVLDGRAEIELEDLREGIRTVEEHYLFHSRFTRLFSDHPLLKSIMESMFRRPSFAFAIVSHDS